MESKSPSRVCESFGFRARARARDERKQKVLNRSNVIATTNRSSEERIFVPDVLGDKVEKRKR